MLHKHLIESTGGSEGIRDEEVIRFLLWHLGK